MFRSPSLSYRQSRGAILVVSQLSARPQVLRRRQLSLPPRSGPPSSTVIAAYNIFLQYHIPCRSSGRYIFDKCFYIVNLSLTGNSTVLPVDWGRIVDVRCALEGHIPSKSITHKVNVAYWLNALTSFVVKLDRLSCRTERHDVDWAKTVVLFLSQCYFIRSFAAHLHRQSLRRLYNCCFLDYFLRRIGTVRKRI